MKLNTKFSCGDKAWCIIDGSHVSELTVGSVRTEFTDSPGTGNEIFDNYKAQKYYKEMYMCIETGIGTGSVYEIDKNIFANKILAENKLEEYHEQAEG